MGVSEHECSKAPLQGIRCFLKLRAEHWFRDVLEFKRPATDFFEASDYLERAERFGSAERPKTSRARMYSFRLSCRPDNTALTR